MKDKKLQVFVSSTFTDLQKERQAAVEAILSSGNIPAGMELFSAGDESQMTVIKRWIDESDIYLLILGGRYGSVEESSGKSYTHLEYEYALSQKKPLFSVVISEKALDEKIQNEGRLAFENKNPQLLESFRQIVLSNLVKFWDDKKDIKIAIHETLSDFAYRKGLVGWVRGDNNVDVGSLAEEIARLTKENYDLRDKLQNHNSNEVFYGGLTFQQLEEMLDGEKVETESGNVDLIEYFLSIGTNLTPGIFTDSKELRTLGKYKLVQEVGDASTFRYIFTEDGHNFYLNALYNRNKKAVLNNG